MNKELWWIKIIDNVTCYYFVFTNICSSYVIVLLVALFLYSSQI